MKDLQEIKISLALEECNLHVIRIRRVPKIIDFLPLTIERKKAMTDMEVEHIDHLIFRFTKLQDALGRRLFPSLYLHIKAYSEEKVLPLFNSQ